MSIYNEMQGIGRELLSQDGLGQTGIVLVKMIPQAGADIDDPLASVLQSHPIRGGAARGPSFRYVQEGLALASDTQVTLPVQPGIPAPSSLDFLEIDGVRYKIIEVIPKPQAGTPVVHVVIARR